MTNFSIKTLRYIQSSNSALAAHRKIAASFPLREVDCSPYHLCGVRRGEIVPAGSTVGVAR